jgi:hypothetical protein
VLPLLLAVLTVPTVCYAPVRISRGTTIAVRPCTSTEHPTQTNAIPFQESFESYADNALIKGTNGWYSGLDDMTLASNAALPGTVVEFPIATNHSRYAWLRTEGDYLVNMATGSQQHVWVDMLASLVVSDSAPPTNAPQQFALYTNYRSNLCVYARPPNTNKAIQVESACRTYLSNTNPPTFIRLSVHLAYLGPPTGGCFAVYLNDTVVNWPDGETLPGIPATDGQGPWLRCVPGTSNAFPGIAFGGNGFLDDLVVTDRPVLPGTTFSAHIEGAATVRWPSDFGRRYQVDACTNLIVRGWQPVGEPTTGNGLTNVCTDADALPARFYRVRSVYP